MAEHFRGHHSTDARLLLRYRGLECFEPIHLFKSGMIDWIHVDVSGSMDGSLGRCSGATRTYVLGGTYRLA